MRGRAKAAGDYLSNGISTITVRLVLIAVMLVLPVASLGFVQGIDNSLFAKRFEWAPRTATGNIVFVAIDKHSLDAVGTWPWPRSIYATLLDKLIASGAKEVFLDVDFSATSSREEDELLAAALARSGGGVLLPVFRQQETASSSETAVTRPIPQFLENAWPAFANVALDADGIVRRFDLGSQLDGNPTQSAAAALGRIDGSSGSLAVDYSIRPDTVPTFSLSGVLNGTVPAEAIKDRSVVVGASAAELKDIFAVPVYGAIAGPLIHVLAAETLLQKRFLRVFDQVPLELLFATLLIVGVIRSRSTGIVTMMAVGLTIVAIGEISAFLLQWRYGILVATAVPWLTLLLAWMLALNERVDLGRMLVAIANTEVRNTRRLMRRIIADSSDGVVAFDSDLRIVEASASAKAVLRAEIGASLLTSTDAAIVDVVRRLVAEHDAEPGKVHTALVDFADKGSQGTHYEASVTISPIEQPHGHPASARFRFAGCLIIRDITARYDYEERLKALSELDDLTGLLNRREFASRLATLEGGTLVSVLDIERFSSLCATLGRDVGDELLKAVAVRLGNAFAGNLLARLDRDHFGIATPAVDAQAIEGFAKGLLDLFEAPLQLRGSAVPISVHVGIASSEDAAAGALLNAAESALDAAKTMAGRQWSSFDPSTAVRQARSRRLERDMRDALRDRQFFLLFQPQIEFASGRLLGAEALIRWNHPEFGLISPAEFIPIAESSGLICEIGRWTLFEACTEAAAWPGELGVAVNVSALQFEQSDIEADVREALSNSGLPSSRLCLELTESAFLGQGGLVIEKMRALRETGGVIALDDFGTGYSSMSYLADLPLDKLKIDQSFVRRMKGNPTMLEIVRAIISLAHGLKLQVVAEGVETETEAEALQRLGCETGQGYLFGRPDEALRMLSNWSVRKRLSA
ncbi:MULTISPECIES: EAL domain-containing protein [unclassified Rhizobium]|uniref:EAL domain-containing protein n=1 Tax=unclassified Rhizobium TaxID=2613769 RepID=UPI0007E92806|nr:MULTISPECIES: EAL domain-containing protein [unclassified Rhizobium]ANM10219.1 GGDEF/EAL domain-containing protein [Rhizobium sp. N324]ANM16701.1 GGDEF/EAL domain-containing protein [Rhizobium sp. N541]ANM23086.1 GGDEF/EAL domain-containing protein [Rhizobium sp. N941]OYD03833.1 GGDEF/EAL domain-containing protein [Rhizobium sp. N4311]